MNYLRIIDQTKVGVEVRRNIPFEGEYSVLMSVPVKEDEEPVKAFDSEFSNAIDRFYNRDEEEKDKAIDPTIVGFVYINEATYPIRDFNVVYIVNKDGGTIERVYGQHIKY